MLLTIETPFGCSTIDAGDGDTIDSIKKQVKVHILYYDKYTHTHTYIYILHLSSMFNTMCEYLLSMHCFNIMEPNYVLSNYILKL